MTQYTRGRDFEYKVCYDMRDHGYLAMRTPGSHSPVDVYCIKRNELIFIQCKISGRLDRDEWNKFLDFCDGVDATPIMAERIPRKGIAYHELLDWKGNDRKPGKMRVWHPTPKEDK